MISRQCQTHGHQHSPASAPTLHGQQNSTFFMQALTLHSLFFPSSGHWRGLQVALKTLVFEMDDRTDKVTTIGGSSSTPLSSNNSNSQPREGVTRQERAILEAAVAATVDHRNVVSGSGRGHRGEGQRSLCNRARGQQAEEGQDPATMCVLPNVVDRDPKARSDPGGDSAECGRCCSLHVVSCTYRSGRPM